MASSVVASSSQSCVSCAGIPNARSEPPLLLAKLNGKVAHFFTDTVSLVNECMLEDFRLSSEVLPANVFIRGVTGSKLGLVGSMYVTQVCK